METVRRGRESRSRGEEMDLLILKVDQLLILKMDQVAVFAWFAMRGGINMFLLFTPLPFSSSPLLYFRQHLPPNNGASDSVKFEKVCR